MSFYFGEKLSVILSKVTLNRCYYKIAIYSRLSVPVSNVDLLRMTLKEIKL